MKQDLAGGLVWAGLMLALAAGGAAASRLGYVSHETVTRAVSGAIGLWLVWSGNRIPKTFVRNACARRAKRVTAWSMVVSGLVYAGLWAFAPLPVATWAGASAILTGLVISVAYCLSLPARTAAR